MNIKEQIRGSGFFSTKICIACVSSIVDEILIGTLPPFSAISGRSTVSISFEASSNFAPFKILLIESSVFSELNAFSFQDAKIFFANDKVYMRNEKFTNFLKNNLLFIVLF